MAADAVFGGAGIGVIFVEGFFAVTRGCLDCVAARGADLVEADSLLAGPFCVGGCGTRLVVACRPSSLEAGSLALIVLATGLTRAPWRGSNGGSMSGSISSLVIAVQSRQEPAGTHCMVDIRVRRINMNGAVTQHGALGCVARRTNSRAIRRRIGNGRSSRQRQPGAE